jgi:hypothetical protein
MAYLMKQNKHAMKLMTRPICETACPLSELAWVMKLLIACKSDMPCPI